jgi:nitric oxide reductase NorQ protein
VTLRVSDYVDIGDQEAAGLIDAGATEGVFTLDRGTGESTTIVGVSPQDEEQAVITEAFGGPAGATDTADFQSLEVVTESIATALRDAGYATFTDLADADVGDLAGVTGTLTESRAEAIIQAAPRHVPVGVWLARSADVRYGRRVDETTGRGTAQVVDITAAAEPVGEPCYRSAGLEPDAVEAQYVSNIGRNEQDLVPTGLHVLDDLTIPKSRRL